MQAPSCMPGNRRRRQGLCSPFWRTTDSWLAAPSKVGYDQHRRDLSLVKTLCCARIPFASISQRSNIVTSSWPPENPDRRGPVIYLILQSLALRGVLTRHSTAARRSAARQPDGNHRPSLFREKYARVFHSGWSHPSGSVGCGAVSCMSLAYEFLADERRGYTLCNGNSRIRAFSLIIKLLKRVAPRPFLGARLEQRLSR